MLEAKGEEEKALLLGGSAARRPSGYGAMRGADLGRGDNGAGAGVVPSFRGHGQGAPGGRRKGWNGGLFESDGEDGSDDGDDTEDEDDEFTFRALGMQLNLAHFLRNVTGGGGAAETVLCGICLENVAVEQTTRFRGGPGCKHRFCRDCLGRYLETRVQDGHTSTRCPAAASAGVEGCRTVATRKDHRRLLGREGYRKYRRFRRMRESEHWRDCPACGAQNLGDPASPAMVCSTCGHGGEPGEFCYFHSNAHPGLTCAEYEARVTAIEEKSQALVSRVTKNCPRCAAPTIKRGGCNHMLCPSCRCNYCWLCMRDIDALGTRDGRSGDPVGWHYNPENPDGCANKQFIPDVPARFLAIFEVWDAAMRGLFALVIFGAAFAVSMTLFSVLALFLSYYAMVLLWIACRIGYAYAASPYQRLARCVSVPIVLCVTLISIVAMAALYAGLILVWTVGAVLVAPLLYPYFRCRREWSEAEVWALLFFPVTYVGLLTGVGFGDAGYAGNWLYEAVAMDMHGDEEAAEAAAAVAMAQANEAQAHAALGPVGPREAVIMQRRQDMDV